MLAKIWILGLKFKKNIFTAYKHDEKSCIQGKAALNICLPKTKKFWNQVIGEKTSNQI